MSNPANSTPTSTANPPAAAPAPAGLFASAAAPASATAAITAPQVLLDALRVLANNGYPGIFANGDITVDAKASFHLAMVDKVTVVTPSIRGTSAQLALAAATLGMAGATLGATLAYNTSFARGRGDRDEGIIPGVYGLVLLAGDQAAVDALAQRISEDHEAGAANARRRSAAPVPVAAAPATSSATSF